MAEFAQLDTEQLTARLRARGVEAEAGAAAGWLAGAQALIQIR